MPSWCSVRIEYGPTGYLQNYKRCLKAHNHDEQGEFVKDAKPDSVNKINAKLPKGVEAATIKTLKQLHLRVEEPDDPGDNYREI